MTVNSASAVNIKWWVCHFIISQIIMASLPKYSRHETNININLIQYHHWASIPMTKQVCMDQMVLPSDSVK